MTQRKTPDLPRIIIDTREQRPLVFRRLRSRVATMPTGDYTLEGHEAEFCVERKSIDDLVGSVTAGRRRFFRELERMRAYRFRRVIVCGPRSAVTLRMYHAQHVSPRVVLAAVTVIEVRYDIPVTWATDPRVAAAMVEEWAYYYARERRLYGDGGKPSEAEATSGRAGGGGHARASARGGGR